MIDTYLEQIQRGKKNSPTFAWEIVHGKKYPGFRRGRYPDPVKEKRWNGFYVDAPLKNKWLNDLSKIPNVEVRASCCGHPPDRISRNAWVSYVVFRVDPSLKKQIKKIVSKLNKYPNTRSGYDVGMEGQPRIVVATPLYFKEGEDNKEWESWWSKLAERINSAVNK